MAGKTELDAKVSHTFETEQDGMMKVDVANGRVALFVEKQDGSRRLELGALMTLDDFDSLIGIVQRARRALETAQQVLAE